MKQNDQQHWFYPLANKKIILFVMQLNCENYFLLRIVTWSHHHLLKIINIIIITYLKLLKSLQIKVEYLKLYNYV